MALGVCLVFLIPGAFGQGTSSLFLAQKDYFADYRPFFAAKGCQTEQVEFPPDATIELRATVLRGEIEKAEKIALAATQGAAPAVYLLGHSQGGLDARFVLATRRVAGVSALVTIGTPNHGTPLANWAVAQRTSGSPVYWLLRWLGGYDLRAIPFAAEMTPEFLERKASYFEAAPGVRYAAARGVCRTGCGWALRLGAWWLGLGPSDGVVPGESQRFGQDLGEYDLDHVSEVGADAPKRAERARLLDAIWSFFAPRP